MISYGSRCSRIDQVKYVEDSREKILSDMICLGRPYHLKFLRLSSTNFTWSFREYLDPYTVICCYVDLKSLTYFKPISHFCTLRERQKKIIFLMFSGGIEMEHWFKMG